MRGKIDVIECDRCGHSEQFEDGINGNARHQWGQVYAADLHGNDRAGSKTTPADLCPGCLTGLVAYMGGRSLADPDSAKQQQRSEENA